MEFDSFNEGHGENEETIHFHYNREERLKSAPKNVRDYYKGDFGAYNAGLFKSLVNTRGNKFILLVLVFCIGIFSVNFFFNRDDKDFINSVELSLSAFSFEDTVYVTLEFGEIPKNKKTPDNEALPVQIKSEFEFTDIDGQVVNRQLVSGTYDGKKTYLRTTFKDYDIISVSAEIYLYGEEKILKADIEKR